jgi:membrane-associated phospholipid phosphatase
LLARCQPDLANFAKYVLTGFPTTPLDSALVSAAICTQPDLALLDDGWRSFPSGHASFSAAGLVYLSLFLASKFAITIPFLFPKSESQSSASFFTAFPSRSTAPLSAQPILDPKPSLRDRPKSATTVNTAQIAARNQSASPPIYLLALAFIPTAAAMYIAGTRYADFHHHGFDILAGFFLGTVIAFWAFRYYHLPISRGAGWSWGPRSRRRAFWAGVGTSGYVGDDEEERRDADMGEATMLRDIEAGSVASEARDRDGRARNEAARDTVGGQHSTPRYYAE